MKATRCSYADICHVRTLVLIGYEDLLVESTGVNQFLYSFGYSVGAD